MLKTWQRNGILTVALLAFGAARMPFEAGLTKELKAARLIPEDLEIGTRAKIGQTSSAVALGGLRTLVATFMNLKAFSFFEEQKWDDVADTYDMIVDLAPHTGYYWDSGHAHSAYNAASYYIKDSELSPHRRKKAWRDSILRGRAFLERGIRNNPDHWKLWAALGFLLSNPYKFEAFGDPDKTFTDAADAYHRASEAGGAPEFLKNREFFALARVPGREKEALALGRMLHENPRNRTPTPTALLLTLEAYENPEMDTTRRALELFGTPEKAFDALSFLWRSSKDRFPIHGVAKTLHGLEKLMNVPPEESILNQPLPPPVNVDDWFTK